MIRSLALALLMTPLQLLIDLNINVSTLGHLQPLSFFVGSPSNVIVFYPAMVTLTLLAIASFKVAPPRWRTRPRPAVSPYIYWSLASYTVSAVGGYLLFLARADAGDCIMVANIMLYVTVAPHMLYRTFLRDSQHASTLFHASPLLQVSSSESDLLQGLAAFSRVNGSSSSRGGSSGHDMVEYRPLRSPVGGDHPSPDRDHVDSPQQQQRGGNGDQAEAVDSHPASAAAATMAVAECSRDDPLYPHLRTLRSLLRRYRSLRVLPADQLCMDGGGVAVGEGYFGAVYRAQWQGTQVAVKQFRRMGAEGVGEAVKEVAVMAGLRHPNIVLLVGICIVSGQRQRHGPGQGPGQGGRGVVCGVDIVTEYCNRGSLFQLVHRSEQLLPPATVAAIALQVASGMAYLHSCGILHRDLKSGNVLVEGQGPSHIPRPPRSNSAEPAATATATAAAAAAAPEAAAAAAAPASALASHGTRSSSRSASRSTSRHQQSSQRNLTAAAAAAVAAAAALGRLEYSETPPPQANGSNGVDGSGGGGEETGGETRRREGGAGAGHHRNHSSSSALAAALAQDSTPLYQQQQQRSAGNGDAGCEAKVVDAAAAAEAAAAAVTAATAQALTAPSPSPSPGGGGGGDGVWSWRCKVADFGASRFQSSTMTRMGTVAWTAPEVLSSNASPGPPCDVYSFAVLLYELLLRRLPFPAATPPGTVALTVVSGGRPHIPPDVESGIALSHVLSPLPFHIASTQRVASQLACGTHCVDA